MLADAGVVGRNRSDNRGTSRVDGPGLQAHDGDKDEDGEDGVDGNDSGHFGLLFLALRERFPLGAKTNVY
jgi:hypothetical protein